MVTKNRNLLITQKHKTTRLVKIMGQKILENSYEFYKML
jgi:hypothetical protein